jgi:type II secretory pathway component PulF
MEFNYIALDKSGKRYSAKQEAESIAALVAQLKGEGLLPIQVKRAGNISSRSSKSRVVFGPRRKSIKVKDLAIFTRQLSSVLQAGILITEALATIGSDWHDPYLRKIIEDILGDIRAGKSLSSALSKFPECFSSIYIALVKTGEETGNLGGMLANLAKYLEDISATIQKIKSAVRYPAFILGFFFFTVFVIATFIIPKFSAIFSRAKMPLPLLTKIVIGISELVIHNVLLIFLGLGAIIFISWHLIALPKIRFVFDRYKLKIPILGNILMKGLVCRFARTLSILISGGVGLATSLTISADSMDNLYIKSILEQVKARVLSGFPLSKELAARNIFQKIFVKMVEVGERTGKIGDMLKRNADYYDDELNVAISNFTSLLEPCLIVLIGGVVLIVVLALYLPIFKMAAIRR